MPAATRPLLECNQDPAALSLHSNRAEPPKYDPGPAMNGSGDQHHNLSKTVSLSRSLVFTENTCIPSLLILGKLLRASDDDVAIDMAVLRARLLQDWAPSGAVNFWRVKGGAFLIQFHEEADLRRAMDGAPWRCDGGHLFLMQQAKPEMDLQDQLDGAGFTTADLWVQFCNVPVEYFSAASLCALATRIGVPVVFPDLGASAAQALRARVRVDITRPLVLSLPVEMDDGRRELVSVVYELLPGLCMSCGIIVHPADHCPKGNHQQPAGAAPTPTVVSRSHREKPAGYVWSRLGSRTSSSREVEPLLRKEKAGRSISSSSSGAAGFLTPPLRPKQEDPSVAAEHQLVQEAPRRQHTSANSCLPCNFLNLISRAKKKELEAGGEVNARVVALQDMQRSQKQQTLLLTFSAHQSVQESFGKEPEGNGIRADSNHVSRTLSRFQLDGGYVNYISQPGSRKNPKLEVMVETQCPSHLMKKAMEWLAQNTGLKASYDGNRGVISIVGLQLDQRMGPLDLVAYLYPDARSKTGVSEAQEKPDSPARFQDMIMRLHDVNCCKGASISRNTT